MAATDSRRFTPRLRSWRVLRGRSALRTLLSAALLGSWSGHSRSLRTSAWSLLHNIHLGAALQLLEAAIRHDLAWIQPGHLGKVVVGRSRRDVSDLCGAVLNH